MNLAGVERSEVASECGTYRYRLARRWPDLTARGGTMLFVMLNPSRGNGADDDPTLRRCIRFAAREGCAEMEVVNLFAFRTADPQILRIAPDPVGPENDRHIARAAREALAADGRIVCAWGNAVAALPAFAERRMAVVRLLGSIVPVVHVLGWTRWRGSMFPEPMHPLYLPRDARRQAWWLR